MAANGLRRTNLTFLHLLVATNVCLSLPVRFGGKGIMALHEIAEEAFENSRKFTDQHQKLIFEQNAIDKKKGNAT